MSFFSHISNSLAETDALGKVIAESIKPGLVIALEGNLGAGKTRLTQSVATEMGVPKDAVNSPTFVLIQEYEARIPLYHFDAYRLNDVDEFLELGADELMFGEGVCFIEWCDKVSEVLPKDHLHIKIESKGAASREFQMTSFGPKSNSILNEIQSKLQSN